MTAKFNPSLMKDKQQSPWRELAFALKYCAAAYLPVMRAAGILLATLALLQMLSDQYLDFLTSRLQNSAAERVFPIIMAALLQLLNVLLWNTLWMIALIPTLIRLTTASSERDGASFSTSAGDPVDSTPSQPAIATFISNTGLFFNQLLIEQVRVFAALIIRLPLLLIPTVFEYVRLAFVPLVVLTDPEYQAGHRDALTQSRHLSRGHWLVIAIWLVGTVALPFGIRQLLEGERGPWVWENPWRVSLEGILIFFLDTAIGITFFAFYRETEKHSRLQPLLEPGALPSGEQANVNL